MNKLRTSQKALLLALYLLIGLMIVFSVMALGNLGQEGFDACIQHKCEVGGDKYCTKYREVNNCCVGTGGKIVVSGNKPICVFE